MEPRENKSCYSSTMQRKLLLSLNENKIINNNFFLTGGTALSVFYLHHRRSDDLDFFTIEDIDISEIDFWLQRKYKDITKTSDLDFIKNYLINGIKVEFVKDYLSINDKKERFTIEPSVSVCIDSLRNIASNKLCTLVSRSEVKDYIDFYYINKSEAKVNIDVIYNDSINKDKIFEDYPTAAYKIEEGFDFVRNNYELIPRLLLTGFDIKDFEVFYKSFIENVYNRKI